MNLVAVMLAAGLGAVVVGAITKNMSQTMQAQSDIEMRMELSLSLMDFQRATDCTTTKSGVGAVAAPTPIELKGYSAGNTLVALNGSTRGRFSFVADLYPDQSIRLRTASLRSPPADLRTSLAATDDDFRRQKVGGFVWSWTNTDKLMAANFPVSSTLCGSAGNTAPDFSKPTYYSATGWGNRETYTPKAHKYCAVTVSGVGSGCGRCALGRQPDNTWHLSGHNCNGKDYNWCEAACYD
jgi:hypothetical protein